MTSIHLSGQEYSVSPGAKSFLASYLERVKKYVENKKIGIEYSQDIEMRLAERLGALGHEASEKDAVKIVNELGEPEDIFADVSKKETFSGAADAIRTELRNPLHRDSSKGILFGVAAGLGDRWGIDPLYIRLVFLALFFFYGTGVFLYIALAILMKNQPSVKATTEATTSAIREATSETEQNHGASTAVAGFFSTIIFAIVSVWKWFWSVAGKLIVIVFCGALGLVLIAKSLALIVLSGFSASSLVLENQSVFGAVDPILTLSMAIAGVTFFALGCVSILRAFSVKIGQGWMLIIAIVTIGLTILGGVFGGVKTASQFAHRATGEVRQELTTGSGEITINIDREDRRNIHFGFDAANVRFENVTDGKTGLTVRTSVSGKDAASTDFILSKLKPVTVTQSGGIIHLQNLQGQFSETVPLAFLTRELVFSIPTGTRVRLGDMPHRNGIENLEYSDLEHFGAGDWKCEGTTLSFDAKISRFRCDTAGYSPETIRTAKMEYLKDLPNLDAEDDSYGYRRQVSPLESGLYLVTDTDRYTRNGQKKTVTATYKVDVSPEGKMTAVRVLDTASPTTVSTSTGTMESSDSETER